MDEAQVNHVGAVPRWPPQVKIGRPIWGGHEGPPLHVSFGFLVIETVPNSNRISNDIPRPFVGALSGPLVFFWPDVGTA